MSDRAPRTELCAGPRTLCVRSAPAEVEECRARGARVQVVLSSAGQRLPQALEAPLPSDQAPQSSAILAVWNAGETVDQRVSGAKYKVSCAFWNTLTVSYTFGIFLASTQC